MDDMEKIWDANEKAFGRKELLQISMFSFDNKVKQKLVLSGEVKNTGNYNSSRYTDSDPTTVICNSRMKRKENDSVHTWNTIRCILLNLRPHCTLETEFEPMCTLRFRILKLESKDDRKSSVCSAAWCIPLA